MKILKELICKMFGHKWKSEYYRCAQILCVEVRCVRCRVKKEPEDE